MELVARFLLIQLVPRPEVLTPKDHRCSPADMSMVSFGERCSRSCLTLEEAI